MKQFDLFGVPIPEGEEKNNYTKKIEAPLYEPKNKKPYLLELMDSTKTNRLINEINASNLPADEKKFLKWAAMRHIVFNYEKIADYYAHATPEMQSFMERSALVIIDFDKAIQYGFVKLNEGLMNQFLED